MILDDADAFLARFVAFASDRDRHAVTLWAAHAHLVDCFDSTPRLILSSAEKQSGKTRCLEVVELLVPRPLRTSNASPSAIYRTIGAGHEPDNREPLPTILMDEYDTVFAGIPSERSEDLRNLINAGHRRGSSVLRSEGNSHQPRAFQTFAAVALAGIGDLPDTITDRGVLIRMRRRAPGERVDPFRFRYHDPEGRDLGDALGEWADRYREAARDHVPDMPPELTDRPADVWEPLLAVGELAGHGWAERARATALAHTGAPDGQPSRGVELLADIRTLWPPDQASVTAAELVKLLTADPEMRWCEYRAGNPLSARALAGLLKPFEIRSEHRSTGNAYERHRFDDTWARYLPPVEGSQGSQGSSDGNANGSEPGPVKVVEVVKVPGGATHPVGDESFPTF